MVSIERIWHISTIPTKHGNIMVAVYCGAFGEPTGIVNVSLNTGVGLEHLPHGFVADYAVLLGKEITERAKQARAQRKRWERRGIEGHMPFHSNEIDREDEGEWVRWHNTPHREGDEDGG